MTPRSLAKKLGAVAAKIPTAPAPSLLYGRGRGQAAGAPDRRPQIAAPGSRLSSRNAHLLGGFPERVGPDRGPLQQRVGELALAGAREADQQQLDAYAQAAVGVLRLVQGLRQGFGF
jgi:hypothetical protein